MGISTGMALALGAVGGTVLSAVTQKTPKMPTPQAPEAPPQASQAPDTASLVKNNMGTGQAGGAPGVAQTFLTGAHGIDPASLLLGKNTLLGGGG